MSLNTETLLKSFVEICEDLVSDAYVITDGMNVLTAVLDYDVAIKLCKFTIDKTGNDKWKVASIPNAILMAYRAGHKQAVYNMKSTKEGDKNAEDSELRVGEFQREPESD